MSREFYDLARSALVGVSLHGALVEGSSPYEGEWVHIRDVNEALEALIAIGEHTSDPSALELVVTAYQCESLDGSGEPVDEEVMTQIYFNNATELLANNLTTDIDDAVDGGSVHWLHLEPSKPYVRLHATVNFTGGTTPAVPVFGAIIARLARS